MLTGAQFVERLEPRGSIASETIYQGAEANGVEPFVFIEDPLVDARTHALVEPGAYALQLIQAMYGPRGPRS